MALVLSDLAINFRHQTQDSEDVAGLVFDLGVADDQGEGQDLEVATFVALQGHEDGHGVVDTWSSRSDIHSRAVNVGQVALHRTTDLRGSNSTHTWRCAFIFY